MLHPATFEQFATLPARRSRRRTRRTRAAAFDDGAVLIRPAAADDEPAIARLAALNERPELPGGERLIGELKGRVVAALDVRSGRAVADPFVPSLGIVELLAMRAAQVRR